MVRDLGQSVEHLGDILHRAGLLQEAQFERRLRWRFGTRDGETGIRTRK